MRPSGWFGSWTGAPNSIGWWDGTSWNPFGSGANGPVLASASQGDALSVGGMFTMAGGKSSIHVDLYDPGQIIYIVRPDGLGDFATIQEAIDAAGHQDIVELTDGDFAGPGNRDLDFHGKVMTLRSQSGNPQNCRIDFEGTDLDSNRGFIFQSGE